MTHVEVTGFFLQLGTLIAAALLFGRLARRLGLPAVIGEIAGGVLIGRTVLGSLFPDIFAWLFADGTVVSSARESLIRLGMLFFMFAVGFEVNLSHLRAHARSAAFTSILGMVVPFALAAATVMLLPGLWGPPSDNPLFPVLIGSALAITALPVISRILMDLGISGTPAGTVIMSAATVNDLAGWCLFTAVLGTLMPGMAGGGALLTAVAVLAAAALTITAGRLVGNRLLARWRSLFGSPAGFTGGVALLAIGVAAVSEYAGLPAVFGAFIIGVVAGEIFGRDCIAHRSVSEFSSSFFAPLYFASIGLRADFAADFDPLLVGVVLLVACIGKISGAWLGARLGGLDNRTSIAIGFGMNARGVIEIILANVALDAGVIDRRIFVALVVMAVLTSLLSAPVLKRFASKGGGGPIRHVRCGGSDRKCRKEG